MVFNSWAGVLLVLGLISILFLWARRSSQRPSGRVQPREIKLIKPLLSLESDDTTRQVDTNPTTGVKKANAVDAPKGATISAARPTRLFDSQAPSIETTAKLEVKTYFSGSAKKYYTMEITCSGYTIGYYEKSQLEDVERKKREISCASAQLLDVYNKYGIFNVRWVGERREKVIRDSSGIERGVIPRSCWGTPSWKK